MRTAKLLRAHFRRYLRLEHQHYLQHPRTQEFIHPEFPVKPPLLMWRAGVAVRAWSPPPAGTSWAQAQERAATQECAAAQERAASASSWASSWTEMGEWGNGGTWGPADPWGIEANLFTESDDEISPVFKNVPLPQ